MVWSLSGFFRFCSQTKAVFGNKNLLNCVKRCSYEFFAACLVKVEVVWEGFAEGFDEGLVVFGCVEFFGAEKLAV